LGRWFPRTLRAIGLAEEQADRLLAVPINHSNVRFASHCGRNADIASCPKSANKRLMRCSKQYDYSIVGGGEQTS